jgi:LmbE family N-acetylglucosaminyl deacetylase
MAYIFISPHFDDICFSLGGLIRTLENERKIIINVFTISSYIRRISPRGGEEFRRRIISELRQKEDEEFCNRYNIEQINLGFSDQSGGIAEKQFINVLRDRILEHASPHRDTLVFPMAIGNHIDHLQIFEACCLLMKDYPQGEFVLYEDLPYGHRMFGRYARIGELSSLMSALGLKNYLKILSPEDVLRKREDIMIYESQHVYKRPSKVRIERYFTKTSPFRRPQEGLWLRGDSGLIKSAHLVKNSGFFLYNLVRDFFHMFSI